MGALMMRILAVITMIAGLAGCTGTQNVTQDSQVNLAQFRLGHNIVIASKMQKVPGSREATEDEWVTALTSAFADRFGRYEGNQLYHFGVSVEGYMLAPPGIPVVAAPKSAVVINVTIWDDAAGKKLNDEPHQMLIFESLGQGAVVGSGYTSTGEEQLVNLAFNASRELEQWLLDQQQQQGWFDLKPDTVIAPVDGTSRATDEAETVVAESEPAAPAPVVESDIPLASIERETQPEPVVVTPQGGSALNLQSLFRPGTSEDGE